IDYIIPGNDDAIRSCALITNAIGDVAAEGHAVWAAAEERARKEREERERREAEERARREAEDEARRLAEEEAVRAAAAAKAEQQRDLRSQEAVGDPTIAAAREDQEGKQDVGDKPQPTAQTSEQEASDAPPEETPPLDTPAQAPPEQAPSPQAPPPSAPPPPAPP